MSALTPEQLANQKARQQKKIEKDRRRKQYEDIQIQGTNNSSIVSKRSVEMLYTPKLAPELGEWFHHFVKIPKRRSPAINRGYWIRMESIRQLILKIIYQNPAEKICIVNLGCGYDPLPFQLLSQFQTTQPDLLDRIAFVDIDYPDLVQNKLQMINDSTELCSSLGYDPKAAKAASAVEGIVLNSTNYHLVGCNLRDHALFNRQLSSISSESTHIFIAEVSLAYMKPDGANPVIENASKYPNSHFIILEQLLPAGLDHPFAVKMMYHFNHLRSSLGCVEKYPLVKDQVARFGQYYDNVEANDLFYNWVNLTSEELKERVSDIETFDEWEEFIVFCQHYVIVHATNQKNNGKVYDSTSKDDSEISSIPADPQFKIESTPATFERKFGASCFIADNLYVTGGMGQSRETSILKLNSTTFQVEETIAASKEPETVAPSPRMCHSFTKISPHQSLLIGGRGRPGLAFCDAFVFDTKTKLWSRAGELQVSLSRHSVAVIDSHKVLIIYEGGFIVYDHKLHQTTYLTQTGGLPKIQLSSCGLHYDATKNIGYIVGGMVSIHVPECNERVYQFSLKLSDKEKEEENVIDVKVLPITHWLLSRIGAQCTVIDSKLIVVGGVNTKRILGRDSCIVTIDLTTNAILSIPIDEMLIGFSLDVSSNGKEIVCVGGGGVCYSFGSYYSGSVSITNN